MISFIYRTFRFLLVVCLVLLAGQIPVSGRTIGEHFAIWVKQTFKNTQEKISKSSLVASLPSYMSRLPDSRAIKGESSDATKGDKKVGDADSLSPSDRESLLRVLQ